MYIALSKKSFNKVAHTLTHKFEFMPPERVLNPGYKKLLILTLSKHGDFQPKWELIIEIFQNNFLCVIPAKRCFASFNRIGVKEPKNGYTNRKVNAGFYNNFS